MRPTTAYAYRVRIFSYAQKSEYAKAPADINEAIRLDPNCAEGYDVRSRIYRQKGESDKAEQDAKRAARELEDKEAAHR